MLSEKKDSFSDTMKAINNKDVIVMSEREELIQKIISRPEIARSALSLLRDLLHVYEAQEAYYQE